VDNVRFQFVPNGQVVTMLLSGECDIATHDSMPADQWPMLLEGEEKGLIAAAFQPGTVFEHIDFGINPAADFAIERPDWFEDARVRQAFTMCTNRQRMVDDLLYGRSEIMHAYLPSIHPLYPEDGIEWGYDPAAANALLDSAGYLDTDGDGVREEPVGGSRFEVVLFSPVGNDLSEQIATHFSEDLAGCGIVVESQLVDSDRFFADGPEGLLFGRRFELGAFPWLISLEPNCALYLSTRVPAAENNWNRNFSNNTGFSNPDYDAACLAAMAALPGTPAYAQFHSEAARIWMEQQPVIPLFLRLKVAAARPEVRQLSLDPTEDSELWNLYELDVEPLP
jgi:peptide/nickel transport system substrate-binding protein